MPLWPTVSRIYTSTVSVLKILKYAKCVLAVVRAYEFGENASQGAARLELTNEQTVILKETKGI